MNERQRGLPLRRSENVSTSLVTIFHLNNLFAVQNLKMALKKANIL